MATAVILSSFLCLVSCVLWVRSGLVRDFAWVWLPWKDDSKGRRFLKLDADTAAGQVDVSWKVWKDSDREELRKRNDLAKLNFYHRTFSSFSSRYRRSDPPTIWNAIGFKYYKGQTHTSICFPYWFVTLLTVILPARWLIARLRQRRLTDAGHCPSCGYDLRATPGRCPECGEVPQLSSS